MLGKHLTIRTRILIITACTILVPLSFLGVYAHQGATKKIVSSFENEFVSTLKKSGSVTNHMVNEIEKTSLLVITNDHLRTYLKDEMSVENRWNAYSLLAYLKNSSNVIRSLQLIGSDDRQLTLGNRTSEISPSDMQRAIQHRGRAFWDTHEENGQPGNLYMCRLIRDVIDPRQDIGFIKVHLNLDLLSRELYHDNSTSISFYILDQTGRVMFSTDVAPSFVFPPMDEMKQANGQCLFYPDESSAIVPFALSNTDLTLVGVSSIQPMVQQIRTDALFYTGLVASCFIFCLLLALLLSTKTLKPLSALMSSMRALEEENFGTRIKIQADRDVMILADQFNSMASKIQSLIEEVYSVDISRKEAELRALQTQIKPHFLYNTLDLAYWTAQSESAPITAEMIDSLSQFFRHGLLGDHECTSVANEVEHLRYYIMIQHQHQPGFDFQLDIGQGVLNCTVVKLVLQPLVENAFVHGIRGHKDGQILVSIYRDKDQLIYLIEDNGKGMDQSMLEDLLDNNHNNQEGIGLRNVSERIKLMFGNDYGLQVERQPSGGTIVRVTQPFLEIGESIDDSLVDC